MSKLGPDDLQKMMGNSPLPPGVDPSTMKAQMDYLHKNPEMLKMAMDTLQSLPVDERKKMMSQRYGATKGSGGPGGVPPDSEQLNNLFENPDAIKNAVEMTKHLSDDDLKRMNINSPEEADMMRRAADQLAADPNLAKQMSSMMKNMPSEQLQKMMELSSQMRGGAGGAGGMGSMADMMQGLSGEAGGADQKAAMSAMMSDPDMMKATEEAMKNMSPEMLASMAKASGLDLDEGKAKMIARFLPWLMKGMRLFGYAKKGWSAIFSKKGRYVIAALVLLAAVMQHYREK